MVRFTSLSCRTFGFTICVLFCYGFGDKTSVANGVIAASVLGVDMGHCLDIKALDWSLAGRNEAGVVAFDNRLGVGCFEEMITLNPGAVKFRKQSFDMGQ